MKSPHFFLLLTFIVLSISSASAQYGGGGYNGNAGRGYGSNPYGNSNTGSSMGNPNSQPAKPKEIPVDEVVATIMESMQPALNLDELQVIAISNVLTEGVKEKGVLMKQESSKDDREKNFKALAETTDQKINQFLNKDQQAKYLVFKESQKDQRKPEGRSKKDKNKDKDKDKDSSKQQG